MNKALELLEKSKNMMIENNGDFITFECLKVYSAIKQALLKAQEQEKVLKVIWDKKVDLWRLHYSKNLEDYNTYTMKTGGFTLTQQEFDLLKEVLK